METSTFDPQATRVQGSESLAQQRNNVRAMLDGDSSFEEIAKQARLAMEDGTSSGDVNALLQASADKLHSLFSHEEQTTDKSTSTFVPQWRRHQAVKAYKMQMLN